MTYIRTLCCLVWVTFLNSDVAGTPRKLAITTVAQTAVTSHSGNLTLPIIPTPSSTRHGLEVQLQDPVSSYRKALCTQSTVFTSQPKQSFSLQPVLTGGTGAAPQGEGSSFAASRKVISRIWGFGKGLAIGWGGYISYFLLALPLESLIPIDLLLTDYLEEKGYIGQFTDEELYMRVRGVRLGMAAWRVDTALTLRFFVFLLQSL